MVKFPEGWSYANFNSFFFYNILRKCQKTFNVKADDTDKIE